MSTAILATKLYIPPPRTKIVLRPRLIEQLNEGLERKLTLISAPAGFGKTTVVSEWIASYGRLVAWLSLDEGDNDPSRFLFYIIAALQTIKAEIDAGLLGALQSPQPPSTESILTALLNEITTIPDHFILVLDDYHLIDAKPVDEVLTFLLEHLPPQMHLVIATREDPALPLARYRARGQLTELRAADLRFTPAEATDFLNQVMGLNLSAEDITALEICTEGWIAGLQLAALSMQGRPDSTSFIQAFTGSHRFVLDYLVEEVLQQQPKSIQTFLLRTSILDSLCGSLCDAVLLDPTASSQETLEYLEHANLFIVSLDNERRWFRYHHLFAEMLRQRFHQSASSRNDEECVVEYHLRASQWYEDHGLELEAFQHAAAGNDIERAERLMKGGGIPLYFRGVVTTILDWLEALPTTVLDARPWLWVWSAILSLMVGQSAGVEKKLQAAEKALQNAELDDKTHNLIGQIAAARATLALTRHQPEAMITQARRALEYLHPDNLTSRFRANWLMAMAYKFRGERDAAGRAFTEALSIAQASKSIINLTLATTCLGQIQELENQLYPAAENYRRALQLLGDQPQPRASEEYLGLARIYYEQESENQLYPAAETYRRALQLLGDQPQPSASEVYLGLARICYEWDDLDAAEQYAQQSLQLARQYDREVDRFVISEVFLARLKLAQKDVAGAIAMLAETEQSVRQHNFVHRMPEVAAAQVLLLLHQGNLAAAAHLAQTHDLPISRARVLVSQGNPSAALALLEPLRQQMEAKGWQDERLSVMVLQAVALHTHGEKDSAVQLLGEALALAEPGGFVRIFVDEGAPMAQLLSEAASRGVMPDYIGKLLTVFEAEKRKSEDKPDLLPTQPLIEPLSQRELKVLRLIAQGLSNREISERLFLALSTVKGHNQKIFNKLQVQSRTEAIARARELGLL